MPVEHGCGRRHLPQLGCVLPPDPSVLVSSSPAIRLVLPLRDLLPHVRSLLSEARTPDGWDQARVAAVVAREFDFLGPFIEARVARAGELTDVEGAAATVMQAASGSSSSDDDEFFLVLAFAPPAERDPGAAERTFQRATAQAERGEVKAARRELTRIVSEFPEVAKYHRALGQAHLVLGDFEEAEDEFLRALRLDPRDPDTLTLLGNLYTKRGRPADAIPLYERSLAVARNVFALTNLGAALAETDQAARALAVFREAVAEDAQYPNAWFGLALTVTRLQDLSLVREAVDALDHALAAARERRRAPDVWDNARGLLDSLAVIQAKEEVPAAAALVRQTLVEHETAAGVRDRLPVQLEEAPVQEIGGVLAKIEFGWVHRRPYHRLIVGTGGARGPDGRAAGPASPPEREHFILHELEHLALATAARDAGTNRWFSSTAEGRAKAARVTAGDVKRLVKQGLPESALGDMVTSATAGLLGQLFNFPIDLLIESRLLERYPEIRELVFFSVRRQLETGARIAEDAQIKRITPGVIWRANTAMNGAMALWLEERFPRRTELTARFQKASPDAWSLAKRLYAAWGADAATWEPGAEYQWVDRWGAMLGLQGWYEWIDGNPSAVPTDGGVRAIEPAVDTAPGALSGQGARDLTDGPAGDEQGMEGPGVSPLSPDEEGAATFYMLGALEWAERAGRAQVTQAATQAALIGRSGIRYSDRDSRYALPVYADEPLSGLQLLSVLYVCWKLVDPTVDQGIDLERPYQAARALHDAKRRPRGEG